MRWSLVAVVAFSAFYAVSCQTQSTTQQPSTTESGILGQAVEVVHSLFKRDVAEAVFIFKNFAQKLYNFRQALPKLQPPKNKQLWLAEDVWLLR